MNEPSYWNERRDEFCDLVRQLRPSDALLILRTIGDECTDEQAIIPMLVGLVREAAQRHTEQRHEDDRQRDENDRES